MIPTKRLLLLFIFLTILLTRLGLAQTGGLPAAPDAVREALLDGDYSAARTALTRVRQMRPENADFWMFLEGRSYEMEGDAARAAGSYNALASSHPDSPWRHKADYRRAELLRELGAVEEAEAVWAAAVERLRGTERQDELAEVYLSAADEIVAGELKPDQAGTDWARASDLYGRALLLGLSDAPRDRALRGRLQCAEEQAQWAVAAHHAHEWIAAFGGLDKHGLPATRADGLAMVVRRGKSLVLASQERDARRLLEDLLRDATRAFDAGDPRAADWPALRGDATYWLARSWHDQPERAVAVYRQYLDGAPTPRAMDVLARIAAAWRRAGRSEDALVAYDDLLGHLFTADGTGVREEDQRLRMRGLFDKGLLLAEMERPEDAIAVLQQYVTRYPSGPDWTAAQRQIESTLIVQIEMLASEERHAEERAAIDAFLAERPLHDRALDLRLRIGGSWMREADLLRAGETGPQAAGTAEVHAAIAQWEGVVKKHPSTDVASHALFLIGSANEYQLGDPRSALEAYRRCTFGSWQRSARQRRKEMTETQLEIETERAWLAGETPRLSIKTRNLEAVEVRIFKLDLESYFRKYSTHEGVELLDLDLIAPDQRIDLPIPDYARYARIAFEPELPLEGPGVWAVTVVGDDLTATTLVISSDLDVIAKTSRKEVFVFAQDMAEGRAAREVRLLCMIPGPDGLELHEAVTDETGVARFPCDVTSDVRNMNVLAMKDGSVAACGSEFGPLLARASETHRVFAYTERPVYRRGETVQWRAIARRLIDGVEQYRVGDVYEMRAVDAQGRVIWSRSMPLEDFGSLNGSFVLPGETPLGKYQLRCWQDGTMLTGITFRVEEFRLQRIALELSTAESVYYRGDSVALELSARFHYGSPVADARLALELPDGRTIDLQTDADGVARYEYDTREHRRAQALHFRASLIDEGVSADHGVYLATQGFELSVQLDRDILVSGDELLATIRSSRPDGAAHSAPVQVEWMQLVHSARGGVNEVRVERREIETDADGVARVAFQPESGGSYLLRAMSTDRFGNPVSAQASCEVSGDDDPQRLRLFARQREYSVGETAELELLDRIGPGLTLITIETDHVLDYRLIRTEQGKNSVMVDLTHEHAPGVRVSVAKLTRGEFASDDLDLDVKRALRVSIEVPDGPLEPGSTVPITLVATDMLGRPVEAELSLAIVDEALFDLFPSKTPSIQRAFLPTPRDYSNDPVRTASSCDFSYEPETYKIEAALIAEQERQEEAKQWDERRSDARKSLAGYVSGGPVPSTRLGLAFEVVQTEELEEWNDVIGIGGGAGGKYGGRMGGKRNLRAAGGRGANQAVDETAWLDSITAYWNPSVRTDADGRATLEVTMPERSTRWRLTSHGAGRDAIFGDAQTQLVTRSDLFVELLAPLALTEGDRPTLVARIHNPAGLEGTLKLSLAYASGDDEVKTHTEQLTLDGSPLTEIVHPLTDGVSGSALTVTLEASGEANGNTVSATDRLRIPVRPWGLDVRMARSGSLEARRSMTFELPEASSAAGRTLRLRLGRGIDDVLVDALLGRGPSFRGGRPAFSTVADDAWTLVGLCELLEMSGASVDAAPGQYAEVLDRARGMVATLLANRHNRGGWSDCYGNRKVDPLSTAAASIALGRARAFGLNVPADDRTALRKQLREHFRKIAASSTEERALYLHAMARLGVSTEDFTSRLYRERARLSVSALSHLTLALAVSGRAPMAAEVADAIAERVDDEGMLSDTSQLAFHGIQAERRALALWALHAAHSRSGAVDRLAASLLADRPWGPRRVRGLAVAALAGLENRPAGSVQSEVIVHCTGQEPLRVVLDESATSADITFEFGEGDSAQIELDLELRGRGTPTFVAELSGTAPVAEHLDSDNELAHVWRLRYSAAAPLYRGKPVKVGFSTLLSNTQDANRNPRRECELGGQVEVQVRIANAKEADTSGRSELQVLEIPLPPGARVSEASLKRYGTAYELLADRIVVYLADGSAGAWLDFTITGLYPGEYRMLPATIRSLERPQLVTTGAVKRLRILPRGVASEEPYDPSPDELYELGRLAFENGEREFARVELEMLYRRWSGQLKNEPLLATSRMLLEIAIDRGEHEAIIEHFEVLAEKSPELVLDYEKLLAVATAYREIREHENALRIERALCIETFGVDLRVASALGELGDFLGSTDTLRRLWLEYPDVPTVVSSALLLSDQLLERAPLASQDPALRAAGKDRAILTLEGILELQRFLTVYADDPLASDAALNLLAALFELEDYERAEAFAGRMAVVAEKPRYIDAFLYTQAVARWHLGQDDGAKQLLVHISEALYTDERGRETPSENRDLALYLLGQIHHARQEFGAASEYYERVALLFDDAQEALAGFRSQRIALDEVTEALPGADVSIELRHRNLPEVELLVYPVDLMTLYLRERSLSDVAEVQLSGIAPLVRRVVTLDKSVDLRDRKTDVQLDLKEAGAYLVMVRAGEQFASGLVLISNLALEVDADPTTGHVRVQVFDELTGAFESDVDVRVIGSGNDQFVSGRSDQRGLFVADGILGEGTVIARAGDRRYAFRRGVQAFPVGFPSTPGTYTGPGDSVPGPSDSDLFGNVRSFNAGQRSQRSVDFDKQVQQARGGLQLKQVK